MKFLPPALAALALALWCACAYAAQRQAGALGCVAARWPGGGVSPAQLESQLDLFRQDGAGGLPELTLWTQFPGQTLANGDDTTIACAVTQIYGHGEDVVFGAMLQGGFPVRGDAGRCALSDAAAFALFGSANAMGQSLQWNNNTYAVQGIFESGDALMLAQAAAGSETKLPYMQLRFPGGGARLQAEEFLARADFSAGAILLDQPLVAWGLGLAAALPALLLGLWILARLFARAWQTRKHPRLLLGGLPLLLPLAAADICLLARAVGKAPASLIPSAWSDFTFWSELPQGWKSSLAQWLSAPTGGDIDLVFGALGILALAFLAALAGAFALARARLRDPAHALAACGGCVAWLFAMALHYAGRGGLRISLGMWLLPCLWAVADYGLYAWGRKGDRNEE
ncbi:MAG: hypothetical protein LBB75_00975 [Oscillospiraceae bacterium]|jgi:hypothetical protein|nr:hypothetical protein [Oscillospiraceae bacterium]